MKLDLKELLAKITVLASGGLVPDYAHVTEVTALPYTAPSYGIIMYVVGDGSSVGARDLTVNGTQVGVAYSSVGGGLGSISTITAVVGKGDIVSGSYGIWGHMRFIPYKLGG